MRISDWSSDVCSSDLTTSLVGFTLAYDDRDNRIRPTRGQSFTLSQDFAGLGGSVKYLRTRATASKHFKLTGKLTLNIYGEGGYIYPLGGRPTPTRSEEHTSELQSLMRISYAVFCLKTQHTKTQHIA